MRRTRRVRAPVRAGSTSSRIAEEEEIDGTARVGRDLRECTGRPETRLGLGKPSIRLAYAEECLRAVPASSDRCPEDAVGRGGRAMDGDARHEFQDDALAACAVDTDTPGRRTKRRRWREDRPPRIARSPATGRGTGAPRAPGRSRPVRARRGRSRRRARRAGRSRPARSRSPSPGRSPRRRRHGRAAARALRRHRRVLARTQGFRASRSSAEGRGPARAGC